MWWIIKNFVKYGNNKRIPKVNLGLLLDGHLTNMDVDKARDV